MRKPRARVRSVHLQMARRDDYRIAQALFKRQEVDAIHSLTSAGALDPVFVFMKDIGFIDMLQSFNVRGYHRMMLPLAQFLLTYIAKILLGVPSMNALPDCFSQTPHSWRSSASTASFSPRVFAEEVGIADLPTRSLQNRSRLRPSPTCFNGLISLVAKKALLDKELAVIIDATDSVVSKGFTVEYRLPEKGQICSVCGGPLHEMSTETRQEH